MGERLHLLISSVNFYDQSEDFGSRRTVGQIYFSDSRDGLKKSVVKSLKDMTCLVNSWEYLQEPLAKPDLEGYAYLVIHNDVAYAGEVILEAFSSFGSETSRRLINHLDIQDSDLNELLIDVQKDYSEWFESESHTKIPSKEVREKIHKYYNLREELLLGGHIKD